MSDRMFASSDSIEQLAGALAAAQGEMDNAQKDSKNPYFNSKYADLASVRAACFPALSKHGLAVLQPVKTEGSKVTVTTVLAHKSGQWLSSEVTAVAYEQQKGKTESTPSDKSQPIGACITYLRRYALASMVGVAPSEDDGETAMGRSFAHREPPAVAAAQIAAAEDELAWMRRLADAKTRDECVAVAMEIQAAKRNTKVNAEQANRLRTAYDEAVKRVGG